MENKKIFITGGAGFLGQNIIKRYYKKNEITVYSRDEVKHYYLKNKFPKIKCVIGDVRNFDLMKRASKEHNIGIFAASLKQIGSVDQNYEEAKKIIIDGAINSRRCAEENKMEAACFISSDKSRSATTLYGSMKFVAGEIFIVNSEQTNTRLSTAIYGNVTNSTGSIIPLIWDSIKNNYELTLYSPNMTRFILNVEQAIDVIECSLEYDGYNVIPNVNSFFIKDLFNIYKKEFGLKYVIGKPRISEKIHEIMISKEELPRTIYSKYSDIYLMHYKNVVDNKKLITHFKNNEYSSENLTLSYEQLKQILEKNNYYK